MAAPNQDPKATAGQPMGDDHGGNSAQPEMPEAESTAGMNSENAGALTGSAGLAKARKTTGAKKA